MVGRGSIFPLPTLRGCPLPNDTYSNLTQRKEKTNPPLIEYKEEGGGRGFYAGLGTCRETAVTLYIFVLFIYC